MKRLILIIFTVLLFTTPAVAQEPEGDFIDPFTMPDPVVVLGTPYQPEPEPFAAPALADGPCDYLPEFLDHRGEGDVMPPGYPEGGGMAEVLEWSGIQIDRSRGCERAQPGETYLSVEAIELKCGDAAIQARVDEAGLAPTAPLEGVLLWFSWPNMGDANQYPPDARPRYDDEAVGCFTDGGGSCGFGYGGGSFIVPGAGGPFNLWANDCTHAGCVYGQWVGADAALGLGWVGGTNHCDFQPWFEPRVKEGGTTPPIPTDDAWLGVFENGLLLYHVPLVPGMPPGNTDEFGGLGYIAPDGAWLWHVPGVEGLPQ